LKEEDDETKEVFVTIKSKRLNFDGNPNCELIILSDITAVLKFNNAKSNLELMKTLQASVSHDMRSPLAAITQTTSLLLEEVKDDKKLCRLLQPMYTSSKMLSC